LEFAIAPIADGLVTADFKMSWTEDNVAPGTTLGAILAIFTLVNNDGSEAVTQVVLDLSDLIEDAQIQTSVADLQQLVNQLFSGTDGVDYVFDVDAGTVTVTDISRLAEILVLDGSLFADSNVDFSIPLIWTTLDTATLGHGGPIVLTDTIVQEGALSVDLVGVADVPLVSAFNATGPALTRVPLDIRSSLTDTDAQELGRVNSESLRLVLTEENPEGRPYYYYLVDAEGNLAGQDSGGFWLLAAADWRCRRAAVAVSTSIRRKISIKSWSFRSWPLRRKTTATWRFPKRPTSP
jgi:hypothetical protein